MKIGIVGHGSDKFTERSKNEAKQLIKNILIFDSVTPMSLITKREDVILVSGHSPVGGIDIYAEEIAKELGIPMDLKIPRQDTWTAEYGYKERNLDIARDSDEVHVILVDKYPKDYSGMKFKLCYHCKTSDHVKSGGCWTGHRAEKLGKKVYWHIIKQE